jgi:hypothetical protein
MPRLVIILLLIGLYLNTMAQNESPVLNQEIALKFSKMALSCMQKEYPNKLSQTLGTPDDLLPPKTLHPAFYGCFDWHSSVHGHWMLVHLVSHFPDLPNSKEIIEKVNENLTSENLAMELKYFQGEHSISFERTYGWAWLLKLSETCYKSPLPEAKIWFEALQPLVNLIVERYLDFLPKLTYPVRSGEHPNTAFGLKFALDFARALDDTILENLIVRRSLDYYLSDQNCPLNWEPNGFDFLSPCLEEADLMHQVLSPEDYIKWVKDFLPGLLKLNKAVITPAVVTDRTDPKLVHLDGLNLSRAWCLAGISKEYDGKTRTRFLEMAQSHLQASLPYLSSGDYSGEHWLASFAVYALTVYENARK